MNVRLPLVRNAWCPISALESMPEEDERKTDLLNSRIFSPLSPPKKFEDPYDALA